MKNNNIYFASMALILVSSLMTSCVKEPVDNSITKPDIEFTLSISIPDGQVLKSTAVNSLDAVRCVVLTILNDDGSPTKYSGCEVKLLNMNGVYFTQKLSLKTGTYKLTQFLMLDEVNNTIFAAPLMGSQQAQNVTNPLPILFNINTDNVRSVNVEVLSTANLTPDDFGFVKFPVVNVNTFSFMMAVTDFPDDSLLSALLNITSDSYSYLQNLENIANNVVTIKDELSNYTIVVSKSGYEQYSYTFTRDSLKAYELIPGNLPLIIELRKQSNLIILKPGPEDGIDAMFEYWSEKDYPNRNWGDNIAFVAQAWTANGIPLKVRSAMKFNLDQIPAGSKIRKATLALYAGKTVTPASPALGDGHSTLSGENSVLLQVITEPWDEHTITWNNQPPTSTINQVVIPASTCQFEDYTNIVITSMVQEMINEPSTNYGFMIKLNNENYYRSMLFGSSDYPDETKRPVLIIEL